MVYRRKDNLIKITKVIRVIMLSGLLSACAFPGRPQGATKAPDDAERVVVAKGSVENRVVATGKVLARSTANLAFSRNGAVAQVWVREGELVKAGQPLLTLDITELKLAADQQMANFISVQATYSQTLRGPTTAELQAARAALGSAQASYNDLYQGPTETTLVQARADLQAAEAEVKAAQSSYDRRYQQDPASIGASQEGLALERATISYNRAKAAYDAKFQKPTAAQISSASSQIQQARRSLDALRPISETLMQRAAQMQQAWIAYQAAEQVVKNATLVAPFDGLLTRLNAEQGDWVNAGSIAVEIADFRVPIFEVDVDEVDLGNLQTGQAARVRLQTYPDLPITAKVESVSSIGTNAGSVVNYKVKLSLGKATTSDGAPQPTILINMSGTGEIVTANASDTLVVPNRALTIDPQTKSYSVERLKSDGTTETVPVKLGFRDADQAQVVAGLNMDDTLIIPVRSATTVDNPNQQ